MAETQLEMAKRHVREGEEHVARQRVLIARLRQNGHAAAVGVAQIILGTFEQTLAEYRRHLNLELGKSTKRT
jgi:hypothetical protein